MKRILLVASLLLVGPGITARPQIQPLKGQIVGTVEGITDQKLRPMAGVQGRSRPGPESRPPGFFQSCDDGELRVL